MNNKSCANQNPLCATFVFVAGCTLGAYIQHTEGITHDFVAIGVSTLVFYLTQAININPVKLLCKKIK